LFCSLSTIKFFHFIAESSLGKQIYYSHKESNNTNTTSDVLMGVCCRWELY